MKKGLHKRFLMIIQILLHLNFNWFLLSIVSQSLFFDTFFDKFLTLEYFKNDISSKKLELSNCFDVFDAKYKMVDSNCQYNVAMSFYSSLLL